MTEMLHNSLQNQNNRLGMQKMESDMIQSIDKRFETIATDMDEVHNNALAGLDNLISMT